MKKLHTEIIINAPAEKVWGILMDFQKFPEWNPFILSIEGKQEIGAQLKVVLKNGNSTSVFKPKVLVFEKNKTFEWLGSLPIPGIFNGQHHFGIEKITDGQVKFTQSEQFTGLLAGIIMNQIDETTEKGFVAMNKALKESAER